MVGQLFFSESRQDLSHRCKAWKAGKKVIFYLHGGGYFNGMLPEHWHFIVIFLKKSLPIALFLFSSFLDVTCSNPEIKKYQKSDLILDALGGETAGMLYSGTYVETSALKYMARLKHWMVSPMFGDVSNLPPIHIFGGGKEILRPDMELFYKKFLKYGNNGSFYIKEGMQHIYMIFAIPEANEVLNLISNYIN